MIKNTGTALTVIVDERCTINHMRGTNAAFADRSHQFHPAPNGDLEVTYEFIQPEMKPSRHGAARQSVKMERKPMPPAKTTAMKPPRCRARCLERKLYRVGPNCGAAVGL